MVLAISSCSIIPASIQNGSGIWPNDILYHTLSYSPSLLDCILQRSLSKIASEYCEYCSDTLFENLGCQFVNKWCNDSYGWALSIVVWFTDATKVVDHFSKRNFNTYLSIFISIYIWYHEQLKANNDTPTKNQGVMLEHNKNVCCENVWKMISSKWQQTLIVLNGFHSTCELDLDCSV